MPDTSWNEGQRDDSRVDDRRAARKLAPTVITNAHSGTSREMASREKRYAITMAVRTACFVSMIFVSGPLRWVLLAGAVFLPYIAVILANQANQANTKSAAVGSVPAVPSEAPALTTGPVAPEIIEGELFDEGLAGGPNLQHHYIPMTTSPMTEWPSTLAAQCSARGCTETANFDLQWNNPKIHTPDRRKHWLACAGHRESLSGYLSARGLLRSVEPVATGSADRR